MDKLYNELIEKVTSYNPKANFELIYNAYCVAKEAHKDQYRVSKEPYISHPLEVAKILAGLELNSKTIAAGLLHDVIEDTGVTYEEIAKDFGSEIAQMVDGVSKLTKIDFDTKKEQQVENLRKMFLAMTKDIRVIIIKLSDRLHNMRTLNYIPPEKQIFKATETLEIYAKIAHRLGMSAFKWELEDLSFKYLMPEEYKKLVIGIDTRRKIREEYIENVIVDINEGLKDKDIFAKVDGRVKHLYSIYNKMNKQNKSLDEVHDLFAFRVITKTVNECYATLGVIHELYTPMPGRFKDYIAMPKSNRYQSLHTTVIGNKGEKFEVQIRTWDMHRIAEYGIAAHWKYKGDAKISPDMESKLSWVRQIIEVQNETKDPDEFYNELQLDLFSDEVFVFTPKGDLKNLPIGSTPIDFAYSIHSAVGNKMIGAKINNKMVPLSYKLENGDSVEIITTSAGKGPSRDWLKVVKSGEARSKIKQYFKKENREENIEKGKTSIERELKRQGIKYSDLFKPEYYDAPLKRYTFVNLEDAFCSIGYSGITANKLISRIRDEYRKINNIEDKIEDIVEEKKVNKNTADYKGVIVKGISNCLVKISKCCNPLPGDAIVGYVTRGRGVTIHRDDCINILNDKNFENRSIEVYWSSTTKDIYEAEFSIKAYDRTSLLADITNVISDMRIPMRSMSAKSTNDGIAIFKISVEIKDKNELSSMINKIKRLSGVFEILRKNRKVR